MLQPKRSKFRKSFRGRRKGISLRGEKLAFGDYGLKALDRAWLSAAQIEAGRRAITNSLKRKGRVWIRVFPDKPVSARAAGQRMGGGKGDVDRYVAVVTPGRVIYEVTGTTPEIIENALAKAGDKMPFKTKVIRKED
jgi:large subunit ribosomal protein L16